MQLTLADKKREAADVTSFLFGSDTPLRWRAGQFLRYALPHSGADNRKTTRCFTIASAPFEGIVMRRSMEQPVAKDRVEQAIRW